MVEVWRGPIVESAHLGVAAVANARGEVIAGWGDTDQLAFPRSALKPVQAIALVETGAVADLGLTSRHVALACASHRGEPFQTGLVAAWLADLGLDEGALACGPDVPADEAAAAAACLDGNPRRSIFHMCSGKHCGFLSVARHRGWSHEGYDQLEHPAQQLYLDALSELSGSDARALPFGVDGCALPAPALSVAGMAVTMARFAEKRVASPARRAAIGSIHEAMHRHPEYVSGTGQPGVELARVTQGRIILKTGAEGFMTAFVPGAGLGVALKIQDGQARARMPALLGVLSAVGLLDADERQALSDLAGPPVRNSTGAIVGRVQACGFAAAGRLRHGPE
jgi:L-asparaginase II